MLVTLTECAIQNHLGIVTTSTSLDFQDLGSVLSISKRIYVGNLSFQTTEDDLRDLFSQAGQHALFSEDTDANRVARQFRGTSEARLLADSIAVKFNSSSRNVQNGGYLLERSSLGY